MPVAQRPFRLLRGAAETPRAEIRTELLPMIDNPKLTADLLAKLEAALPLPAFMTPRLASTLRKEAPDASIPKACRVVWDIERR